MKKGKLTIHIGSSLISVGIAALFIITCSDLLAQKPAFTLKADKKEIRIGEQVKLDLEITAPTTAVVQWPALKDTLTKQIEIVEFGMIDTILPKEDVTTQILKTSLIVTSFDTGYQVIPPLTVYLSGDSASTQPFLLHVTTVPIDEQAEIKDIKDPMEPPFNLWEWLAKNWIWLAAMALVVILIVVYFVFFDKDKGPRKIFSPPPPPKPAHILALEKLDEVDKKKLWQNGQLKAYHSSLSEILREYLENRYKINALEQTSDEIFSHMRYLDINETAKNQLRQVLMLSDMVKFAKEKPLANENELSLSNSRAFVESTREIESLDESNGSNQPAKKQA